MDSNATGPNLTWTVGDVSIRRVEERIHGTIRDSIVPGITDAHLLEHQAWAGRFFSSSGRLLLSVHSFVVQTSRQTIVVDTCAGPDSLGPLRGDPDFLPRLDAGIPGGLEAVDIVLCTHFHFDHVGWNTRLEGGRHLPTFPNARYLFARDELDALSGDADSNSAQSSNAESGDHASTVGQVSIAPLLEAGLVDAVERDHRLCEEIRLIPTPGHTPGHVSVVIESRGETAVITGDLAHSPLQFALPELSAEPFDWDSAEATRTRIRFIKEHADTDALVLGTHFPPPTAGWIRKDNGHVWFATERKEPSDAD